MFPKCGDLCCLLLPRDDCCLHDAAGCLVLPGVSLAPGSPKQANTHMGVCENAPLSLCPQGP